MVNSAGYAHFYEFDLIIPLHDVSMIEVYFSTPPGGFKPRICGFVENERESHREGGGEEEGGEARHSTRV